MRDRPPHRDLRHLLFSNSVWVLLRPTALIMKSCATETYVLLSLSEENRKSKHLQMSLQRQHFRLNYLKTPSVGLAGVWARDLPHASPVLYHWANRSIEFRSRGFT